MCGALLTLSHTQAYAKRVNLNNQNKRAGGEGKKWRAVRLGCVLVALEPSGEGGGGVVLGLKPRALLPYARAKGTPTTTSTKVCICGVRQSGVRKKGEALSEFLRFSLLHPYLLVFFTLPSLRGRVLRYTSLMRVCMYAVMRVYD